MTTATFLLCVQLALFQVTFSGGVTASGGITVAQSAYPVELDEQTGCSEIWDSDALGGGVVPLFDDAPEDHQVTDSGACQPGSMLLEDLETFSLP